MSRLVHDSCHRLTVPEQRTLRLIKAICFLYFIDRYIISSHHGKMHAVDLLSGHLTRQWEEIREARQISSGKHYPLICLAIKTESWNRIQRFGKFIEFYRAAEVVVSMGQFPICSRWRSSRR